MFNISRKYCLFKNNCNFKGSTLLHIMFTDTQAEEALLSRLSYSAYLRAEEIRLRAAAKLSVKQVAKLAFLFTIIVRRRVKEMLQVLPSEMILTDF